MSNGKRIDIRIGSSVIQNSSDHVKLDHERTEKEKKWCGKQERDFCFRITWIGKI